MYRWLDDALADESCGVVTANRRLARTLTAEYAQRQLAAGRRVWRSPAIYSQPAWYAVLSAALPPAFGLPLRINALQSRLLWEQALHADLDAAQVAIGPLARLCQEAWQRLHEWRVPLEDCQSAAVGQDQRIFARAAGRYAEQLVTNGWIDDALLPDRLAEAVNEGQLPPPRRLQLAGFDRLTPQFDALLGACERRGSTVTRGEQPAPGTAELRGYENVDAELRAAGRWARRMLEADPEQTLAIVVTQLERDTQRKVRLLREGLLPGWQYAGPDHVSQLNVSLGRRLADYPAIASAVLALRWCQQALNGTEISLLLRSPFIGGAGLSGRARLELRMRDWPDRDWTPESLLAALRPRADRDDAGDWIDRLEAFRGHIGTAPRQSPPAVWAEFLSNALECLGWPGTATLSSDDYQLINRWRDLLSEFSRLGTVCPQMTVAEAVARVVTMAGEAVFQPESVTARVQVLGPLEAAGLEFDRLWVAGVSASEWPPARRAHALLNRDLQRRAGMPDATPDDTADYAARVLERLRGSAPDVVVSYPKTVSDAPELPTALLADLEAQDEDAAPGWHAAQLLQAGNLEVLRDRVPPVGENESIAGGAGTLQKQASEPFTAFAHGRLGLRWLRSFQRGIAPNLRGQLIHDALAALYAERPTRADIESWSSDERRRRIRRALSTASRQHERHADDTVLRLLALERERAGRLLDTVVAIDCARDFAAVADVEKDVPLLIEGVRLGLRFDRVDRLEDGSVAILDYKSGRGKNLLDRDGQPTDLQLVVYSLAGDAPVSGIGLFNLDAQNVRIDAAGPAFADSEDWPSVLGAWQDAARAAARAFARGDVRIVAAQGIDDARPLNLLSRYTELVRER